MIPYALGALIGGEDWFFTGFVFNPIDGNSYLAKMEQGQAGSWQFTLPFTAEPGEGVPLFLFYLFLGHLSRWLGLSTIIVFHAARILGGLALALMLYRFVFFIFKENKNAAGWAYLLALFGSGAGWLIFPFGIYTADFWVAEAYPFLSGYANPHFPLGLAIILAIFLQFEAKGSWRLALSIFLSGSILALLLPFGLVVTAAVTAVKAIWEWIASRELPVMKLFWLLIGGGPLLLYQYWVINRHPVLAGWNAQNITPAPALWDLFLALCPALIFAFWGIRAAWREKKNPFMRLLLVWLGVGLVMIYFPLSLQRRLMTGLFIPVAILAVIGVDELCRQNWVKLNRLRLVLLLTSLFTNMLVLSAGIFGLLSRSSLLYLTRQEQDALVWLETIAIPDAIILASPEMGLYIPAYSEKRVLYGHPFETVDANLEMENLERFFGMQEDSIWREEFLSERKIRYIFFGPREYEMSEGELLLDFPLVYQDGDVKIYDVGVP